LVYLCKPLYTCCNLLGNGDGDESVGENLNFIVPKAGRDVVNGRRVEICASSKVRSIFWDEVFHVLGMLEACEYVINRWTCLLVV